jgi:hypothetical protein
MKYCRGLAKEGGQAVTKILGGGSEVMENEEKTLTLNMVSSIHFFLGEWKSIQD